ncbi:hypothetical protein [Paenibacillus kandeliae]|uniref:hypothetical protein n=1 Tax=Paenibacillus kandeliae TaxID=3231269 RepID=UPI0034578F55
MKPKQILIYGLLSFLIASSLAMYVYLDYRLPGWHNNHTTPGNQLRIENLDDLQRLMTDKPEQSSAQPVQPVSTSNANDEATHTSLLHL